MTAPAPLDPTRIDAAIATWTEILAGRTDAIAFAARLYDAIPQAGVWTLDDSGLWLTAGGAGAVLLVAFDGEAVEFHGLGALLYAASTATSAQPLAEAIENDDVAADVIATGSTTPTPARIGWHAVTWAPGSPVALAGEGTAMLRIVSGAGGDRFAAGFLAMGHP